MSDYRDTKTDVFICRIAQLIDERTQTMIGSLLIERSAYPLREQESFHRFIGRLMRTVECCFDSRSSDQIIIHLQETPESCFLLLLCFALQGTGPIDDTQMSWDFLREYLKEIEEVFGLFVLLASTYESDQLFSLFEKRGEHVPL